MTLINASPDLKFSETAKVELEMNTPCGQTSVSQIDIPPQTFKNISMSEIHTSNALDEAEFGWVRILSDNSSIAGYATVLNRENGAVAIQHLLGA